MTLSDRNMPTEFTCYLTLLHIWDGSLVVAHICDAWVTGHTLSVCENHVGYHLCKQMQGLVEVHLFFPYCYHWLHFRINYCFRDCGCRQLWNKACVQTQHTGPLNVYYPDQVGVVFSKTSSTMPLYWHVGIKIPIRYLRYFPCNPHHNHLGIDTIEFVM